MYVAYLIAAQNVELLADRAPAQNILRPSKKNEKGERKARSGRQEAAGREGQGEDRRRAELAGTEAAEGDPGCHGGAAAEGDRNSPAAGAAGVGPDIAEASCKAPEGEAELPAKDHGDQAKDAGDLQEPGW